MTAYYNEFEPYAAAWLRNLISAGHIAPGDVDERSIVDVGADDLKGYTQCHFFAGIGGWSLAARLAGWSDERELWTGSCPCQPFSVAGKGEGQADERHLWPEQFRLIRARRPAVWMGEQVAAAVGKHWLDGVHSDLESIGYASGAVVVPACAVDAPHRRDRAWIVADARGGRCAGQGEGQDQQPGRAKAFGAGESTLADAGRGSDERWSRSTEAHGPIGTDEGKTQQREWRGIDDRDGRAGARCGSVAHPNSIGGRQEHQDTGRCLDGSEAREVAGFAGSGDVALADANGSRSASWLPAAHGGHEGHAEVSHHRSNRRPGPWGECDWLEGADGKARRFEPSIRLLAHGVPARVGKLRAYGNAIVPQVAAEVIAAFMEARP